MSTIFRYTEGDTSPGAGLFWESADGTLYDLTGHTFSLVVKRMGATVLTKTTGIVGAAGLLPATSGTPNVQITWAAGDLSLTPGPFIWTLTDTTSGNTLNGELWIDPAGADAFAAAGEVLWCGLGDLPPYAATITNYAEMQLAFVVASGVLFNLTGRKWPGVRTSTVRPVTCGSIAGGFAWWDWQIRPDHSNIGPSSAYYSLGQYSCGCGNSLNRVELPGMPIKAVSQVKVDGAVLDPSLYRVDEFQWLVRLPDANGVTHSWPCCQRLDLASTEHGTMEVTYQWGSGPPLGGVRAAAILAYEFYKAATPDLASQCQLPQRITSIQRQGVTMAILDNLSLFAQGLTGIPMVDLWIQSLRAGQSRSRSSIVNPETWAGERSARLGTSY